MSNVFAGYHVVFATKNRQATIPYSQRRKLYNYIFGILKNNNCHTYRINGMSDHVHIAFDLHPNCALADIVRDIKRSSSLALTSDGSFPAFMGWGRGYYAATFSRDDLDSVKEYIINQENHHIGKAFEAEMEWLSIKAALKYHPDDYK